MQGKGKTLYGQKSLSLSKSYFLVTLDDFLSETSFLGKFISTYVRRYEMNIYLSMLLSPLINSIENVDKDCIDISLNS